jgi:AcrR family transcriptional regulator
MGYSKADKAQSRERIAAAVVRIREAGLECISVGETMNSVNLTHGGFYGHFAFRADLIAAALERAGGRAEGFGIAYRPARQSDRQIHRQFLTQPRAPRSPQHWLRHPLARRRSRPRQTSGQVNHGRSIARVV